MDERFSLYKPIELDRAGEQALRSMINSYSREKIGHPFVNYGDHVKFLEVCSCPILVCELRSQFEHRSVKEGSEPTSATASRPRKYTTASQIHAWDYNFKEVTPFTDTQENYTVKDSEWVTDCSKCGASGKIRCSNCNGNGSVSCSYCHGNGDYQCSACSGRGEKQCSSCGGTGRIAREESKIIYDSQHPGGYTKREWKYYSCSSCGGSGKKKCESCGGKGRRTCGYCDGTGKLTCSKCNGRGKVTCDGCSGYGHLRHYYYINRCLSSNLLKKYHFDSRVGKFQEVLDKRGNLTGDNVFQMEDTRQLAHDIIPWSSQCNSTMNGFLDQHSFMTNGGCLLFQRSKVLNCDVKYIRYSFKGKEYQCAVYQGKFIPGDSPITEFSEDIVNDARSDALSAFGALRGRRKLQQAQKLGTYGQRGEIDNLNAIIDERLNTFYKMGLDLVFWLAILCLTPLIFTFYQDIDPVPKFLAIMNSSDVKLLYPFIGITQSLIFLGIMLAIRIHIGGKDNSKRNFSNVPAYIIGGMGEFLGLALLATAIFMVLNYFGLELITTWIVGVILWTIVIILAIIVYAAVIAFSIIRKIWKWIF